MPTALVIAFLAQAGGVPAAVPTAFPDVRSCPGSTQNEVVVCGHGATRSPYRIDSNVLQAERAENAVPDRLLPRDPAAPCVGPNCGGTVIPILPVIVKVATAAVDAASGNDWRQDFRTHPDEYKLYEDSKAKDHGSKVTFSVGASSR